MSYMEVNHISKIYLSGNEQVAAVSDVSLRVEQGEFLAVTGPSGCGKSTLLHILGGLSRPSAGSVLVGGEELYRKKPGQLALYRRRQAGIVYQFYNLVPELTARENLILPAWMDHREIDEGRVDRILGLLGMSDKRNAYPHQLSGGQQQKIAVGRALFCRPKLLLADEPTGNLDSAKRDQLLELFQRLNRQEGMTVILVTHDQEIALTAPRRIYMADGSIRKDVKRT